MQASVEAKHCYAECPSTAPPIDALDSLWQRLHTSRESFVLIRSGGKIRPNFIYWVRPLWTSKLLTAICDITSQAIEAVDVRLLIEATGSFDKDVVKWVSVPVGCGKIDQHKGFSLLFRNRDNPSLRQELWHESVGFFFDMSTWTGASVFRPADSFDHVVVTRCVADALIALNVPGVKIENCATYGSRMRDILLGPR